MTASRFDVRLTASYLNCPRCGLSIEVRSPLLAIRHCPRCIGRSRTVVELFGSGLPVDALYAENSRPAVASRRRAARSQRSAPLERMSSR